VAKKAEVCCVSSDATFTLNYACSAPANGLQQFDCSIEPEHTQRQRIAGILVANCRWPRCTSRD
jgi:hypothetical protein